MRKLTRFLSKKRSSRLVLLSSIVLVVAILVFYSANPASALISSVTTNTSSSTATSHSFQRKTWYDGTRFWASLLNGSDVEFWYSPSGSTWTKDSSATLTISTDDYAIQADSSNAYIVYVNTSTGNVDARKASSYPGTGFSWGSASTAQTKTSSNRIFSNITRDTSGYLWAISTEGSAVLANKSSNTDDTTSWGSEANITVSGIAAGTPIIVPLASGNVYAMFTNSTIGGTVLYGKKNTSGTWDVSAATIDTSAGSSIGAASAVSKTSAGEIYLTYLKTTATKFIKYVDGSGWGSIVSVDNGTDASPAIMLNSSTLYIYWVSSNAVNSSNSSSPYSSWSAASTVYNTGTNTNTSMPATDGGRSTTYGIWTNGTGSPYTVYTDLTIANSAPNTPTLSTPTPNNGSGRPTTTTPKLLMSATDPDSDTLKYKVYLYNTSANDGTNCTGSAVSGSPWDQNTSATGWDSTSGGNDPYSSGATAGFTVQTTLTLGNSYCFQAQAKDPNGSNTFGSLSLPSTFTLDSSPATPALDTPGSGASNISILPLFRLRSTDADGDYLTYFIQIYDATACGGSQVGGNIDESGNHSGWQREDANTNQAYKGASSIGNSSMAIYQYSGTALTANHLYSWRAKVQDPGGTASYSSLTSCQDFTTNTEQLDIQGGVTIQGGTIIQ